MTMAFLVLFGSVTNGTATGKSGLGLLLRGLEFAGFAGTVCQAVRMPVDLNVSHIEKEGYKLVEACMFNLSQRESCAVCGCFERP